MSDYVIRARVVTGAPSVTARLSLADTQAVSAGVQPSFYKGENGKSPYLGENGNWFIYDDTAGRYVDTGETSIGVTDYEDLDNLPVINGMELKGALDADTLGLMYAETEISNSEIAALWAEH